MSTELVEKIVKILDSKKGFDIEVLQTEEQTIIADYFIIVTANSNTHLRSLADEVEFQLGEGGVQPDHVEGRATGWVVMEYQGVIVHLFLKDAREYYNLERLWSDAAKVDITNWVTD